MSNSLEQLKQHTVVVADTGDFESEQNENEIKIIARAYVLCNLFSSQHWNCLSIVLFFWGFF